MYVKTQDRAGFYPVEAIDSRLDNVGAWFILSISPTTGKVTRILGAYSDQYQYLGVLGELEDALASGRERYYMPEDINGYVLNIEPGL